MRKLPKISVLHRRRGLKAVLALALVAPLGCAKFPDNPSANDFTRIRFTMRVQGKINTTNDEDPLSNYLYFVAIRASAETNPNPNTHPIPVFDISPNGFVAGQPTHFVEFDTLNPQQSFPYRLYRFARTGNPADPINLASYSEVQQPIINFVRPTSDGAVIEFEVFTSQLADTEAEARALTSLQVNFLTMNKLALQNTSSRVIDFLGDNNNPSELNGAVTVDLRSNNRLENGDVRFYIEPESDTADPDLDIVDWTIEVRQP